MNIEKATLNDTKEIVELFTNTIHKINIQNYSQEQIEVWAPTKIDYKKWKNRFEKIKPYIVKSNNKIVGFFEKSSFVTQSKNIVKKDKIELVNYIMTRQME